MKSPRKPHIAPITSPILEPYQLGESVEARVTRLIQWQGEVIDYVASLGTEMSTLTQRVDKLETGISNLSIQLTDASATNQGFLQEITNCLVGITTRGMQRPGLCDDVKDLKGDIKEVSDLLSKTSERLSSLERTRATIIAAWGTLSTLLTALAVWVWSHTDQILTTVNTIYGKPKTEISVPPAVDSK